MKLFIRFDEETKKWFSSRTGIESTVCECEKCGLFYKPLLGHKCKKKNKNKSEDTE